MIDLHCHLLPAIDDGPGTIDESIAMARAHVDAGVRCVACTPHVDWTSPNKAQVIAERVDELRVALAGQGIDLQVVPGGEVGLTRAIETDAEELSALRLGGGPWLLLEAPLGVHVGIDTAVSMVAMRGHRILLAHPERCPAFHRDLDALTRLVDQGVLCQATATALTGQFGRTVQRVATRMVEAGLIHVVASDAHDDRRRPPGLREHVEQAGFGHLTSWLTEDVPAAILAGGAIPARPAAPAPARRRWWRRG
jgi:protein-tyrosine phosphatase